MTNLTTRLYRLHCVICGTSQLYCCKLKTHHINMVDTSGLREKLDQSGFLVLGELPGEQGDVCNKCVCRLRAEGGGAGPVLPAVRGRDDWEGGR